LLLLSVSPFSASADEFPSVDCVISPYQIVDLGSAVPGVIDRLLVERSDFVSRGQVIAELAAGVERATVELAKARAQVEPEINVWQVNVDFDEKRKARIHSLYERRVISDDNRDEADREAEISTWKLQQARDLKRIRNLELDRAEEQLKQKIIHSPIDGFVLEKFKWNMLKIKPLSGLPS
jgi:multidrug efflux pump subunit AcrA (membrane-fusion protein)